jgi:ATP-dependent Clp protease ATP-binding subunit ClpA
MTGWLMDGMMNTTQAGSGEPTPVTLALARLEARRFGHAYVRAEHLLLALLNLPGGAAAQRLNADGVTYARFAARVTALPVPACGAEARYELAAGAKRAVAAAQRLAGSHPPDTLQLLRGIFQVSPLVRELLADTGFQPVEWIQD